MGVTGGVPPDARATSRAWPTTCPAAARHWGVIGISRVQWTMVAAALTLGGSIRVGLEDNFYLPDGEMARSNGDLIAKARQMTEDVGRRAGDRRRGARAARLPSAGRRRERLPLEGVRVLDLSPPAAGRLLLAAARRLRRRRAQGRGHRHGRLHALVAALLRGRRGQRQVGAVPRRSTATSARSASTSSATPAARCCCGSRATPTCCSSRSAPACSTASASATSACARRTPALVYCAITGYGQDGPLARPLRPRHELPRARRAARPHRRAPTARRSRPPARSPTSAAAR